MVKTELAQVLELMSGTESRKTGGKALKAFAILFLVACLTLCVVLPFQGVQLVNHNRETPDGVEARSIVLANQEGRKLVELVWWSQNWELGLAFHKSNGNQVWIGLGTPP